MRKRPFRLIPPLAAAAAVLVVVPWWFERSSFDAKDRLAQQCLDSDLPR
jgi:hypothetical protein